MGANEFRHVRQGDPLVIPASTYNAILDATQTVQSTRNITLTPVSRGFDSLFIYVENCTEKDLSRFSVVGLDGPVEQNDFDIFSNQIAFRGVVPEKKHCNRFAILQQDAAPNEVVRAVIYGVTIAPINITSPVTNFENLACCAVVDNTFCLTVGGSGASVLWAEDGVGPKWGIISIGSNSISIHTGKVATDIKAGLDPEKAEHGGTVDEDDGDAGQRAFAGLLDGDETIPVDTRVEWINAGGVNRIINARCL